MCTTNFENLFLKNYPIRSIVLKRCSAKMLVRPQVSTLCNGEVKGKCCEAPAGIEVESSIATKSPHLYKLIHRSPQELGVCSHRHVDQS